MGVERAGIGGGAVRKDREGSQSADTPDLTHSQIGVEGFFPGERSVGAMRLERRADNFYQIPTTSPAFSRILTSMIALNSRDIRDSYLICPP